MHDDFELIIANNYTQPEMNQAEQSAIESAASALTAEAELFLGRQ